MELRYNRHFTRTLRLLLGLMISFVLVGCYTKSFSIKDIGKSSVDMVIDLHRKENQVLLGELIEKLYKRNPAELRKYPSETIESRKHELLSSSSRPIHFTSLQNARDIHAMDLAFDPTFTGDRVFALMAGLTDMLNASYNYHKEFFLWDNIDENRIYRSARNIDILAWKLKTQKLPNGQPFLVTDNTNGVTDNTSFERLYGKLIANQDMVAKIVGDRTNRNMSSAIQTTTLVFLPL